MKKSTELKKFLKIIRAKNNENMEKMAKKLNISVSYLSMIENGERKVKGGFVKTFLKKYKLNKKEEMEFEKAILDSDLEITINLRKLNGRQKNVALLFLDKIGKIKPAALKEIVKIIEKF